MLERIPGINLATIEGRTLATLPGPFGMPITCEYWQEPEAKGDRFRYKLGAAIGDHGHVGPYPHPTEYGCQVAIRKFFVEAGLVPVPDDNGHLDDFDKVILSQTVSAFECLPASRPRVGDFVEIEGKGFHRVCALHSHGAQTTLGGSFYIYRDGLADYSGSLDCSKLYERFQLTDERRTGRFWFFHHGQSGAGRGVNVNIPCRVFKLTNLHLTEEQARAHPAIAGAIAFWGADHREVTRAIESLMRDPL